MKPKFFPRWGVPVKNSIDFTRLFSTSFSRS